MKSNLLWCCAFRPRKYFRVRPLYTAHLCKTKKKQLFVLRVLIFAFLVGTCKYKRLWSKLWRRFLEINLPLSLGYRIHLSFGPFSLVRNILLNICIYKVVQIWPGLICTNVHTNQSRTYLNYLVYIYIYIYIYIYVCVCVCVCVWNY